MWLPAGRNFRLAVARIPVAGTMWTKALYFYVLLSLFLTIGGLPGCASNEESEGGEVQRRCPNNMTLRCFKRTAETEECTCVEQGKIERLFEF